MIVFFAYLGVVCKKRIPQAHTVLEIVRIRYGTYKRLLSMLINILTVMNRHYCTYYFHFLGNRQQPFQYDKHDLGCCGCNYISVGFTLSTGDKKLLLTVHRTGIHIMASTFLLPVGVVLYTLVGGIKATFVLYLKKSLNSKLTVLNLGF